jgi:hypothetical protein
MIDSDEIEVFWEMPELEALVRKLVLRGESMKVDLKVALDLSTEQSKAELLKDISAMANTLDHANRNYGFVVLGATANAFSYTQFTQNEDLQATIDELVKHYIEPFVPSRLYMFGQGQQQWGVILIPPTRSAPHVFVKDIHKRSRGDIYVRRGTVTEKAMPADYARFFGQRLEEHAYQLRVEMRELHQRVNALESGPRPGGRRTKAPLAPDAPLQSPPPVGSPAPDLLQEIEQKLGSSARSRFGGPLASSARNRLVHAVS